jgi:hypothetical protein
MVNNKFAAFNATSESNQEIVKQKISVLLTKLTKEAEKESLSTNQKLDNLASDLLIFNQNSSTGQSPAI